MMRFELGLDKPQPRRSNQCCDDCRVVCCGRLYPLSPYILLSEIQTAQIASVGATLIALLIFGYIKGRLTGTHPLRSALQTMLVGGIAAFVAFAIASWFRS
jgi:predicted membrane protein (TIGR00267 family)